jgi:hypothetical protein
MAVRFAQHFLAGSRLSLHLRVIVAGLAKTDSVDFRAQHCTVNFDIALLPL